MMKGSKRHAVSDSAPDTNDTMSWNKRPFGGSLLSANRPEPSQQQSSAMPPLDEDRAKSSQQHVRALNTQFASWVQTQLKNHPDKLWEDGVRDYLAHASGIMEKFSDVVKWLKANAIKGGSAAEFLASEKKLLSDIKNNESKLFQGKTGFTPSSTSSSTSVTTPLSFGISSTNQSSGIPSSSQSSGFFSSNLSFGGTFSTSQGSSMLSSGQCTGLFSQNLNSGLFSSSQISGIFSNSQSSGIFSNSQSSGIFSNSQSSGLVSNSQCSGLFSNNQSSELFSNRQSSGLFSNSQTPVFGGQSLVTTTNNCAADEDDENELEKPSSPSVKKSEEKDIVVVHEVKCKLYVKSSDPADKDTWKDKGTGHLSIKCKEGVSKGTKESEPTVIVRNEVGKVLLNALLYAGIKTNQQKNSIVIIFHTSTDDGGNNDAVARTFFIRTKTEEDRNKLAAAIQEYAPES